MNEEEQIKQGMSAPEQRVNDLEEGIQSVGALIFAGCQLQYKDDYRWHIVDLQDGSDVVEPHVSLISVVISAKDKFDNNDTAAGKGA